jgi:hypothetical protein
MFIDVTFFNPSLGIPPVIIHKLLVVFAAFSRPNLKAFLISSSSGKFNAPPVILKTSFG